MSIFDILGGSKVIEKGIDLIDEAFTTDVEMLEAKTKAKSELLKNYAPFKIAQRYIAFSFTIVFLFIMLNGVIGALYGVIDMYAVKQAMEFSNEMWLGEIMLAIVSFYFGGGLLESKNKK